jgi:predicted DNA-binding ribbon-helix-helix protein
MLKNYLVQRHISLESGRSSIALERGYWTALEKLAYDDGWLVLVNYHSSNSISSIVS